MPGNERFFDELARGVADFYQQKPFPSAAAAEDAMDDLDALEAKAEQHGLTPLKTGGDRVPYHARGDGYVVKVSKRDGHTQNAEAVRVWQQMTWKQPDGTPGGRKSVAPIVSWSDDFRWIVQKYAKPTAGGMGNVLENLHEAGWTCSDVDGGNVGVYKGRHVLLDLGIGLRKM